MALEFTNLVLSFQVSGNPHQKDRQRHRVNYAKATGRPFVQSYKTAETEGYEKAIGWRGAAAMKGRPPFVGQLAVTVTAVFGVPPSWTKVRQAEALAHILRPTGSPDADNVLKAALDGLNKIAWKDDAQVVDARVLKFYGPTPFLQIEIFTP